MSVKTKSNPAPKVSKSDAAQNAKKKKKHELSFANLPNFLPNLENNLNSDSSVLSLLKVAGVWFVFTVL